MEVKSLSNMASPNCRWASLRYKSALQTTKAPPLSAGLITMSLRAWSDWRALNSLSVRLDGLLGLNLGELFYIMSSLSNE
jgi:hypothetical protein